MRIVSFLLIATIPLLSGCAALIAQSGTDLTQLQTREEIHTKLGKPSCEGIQDGKFFEEYRTRRKIAEDEFSLPVPSYGYSLMGTCGAIDLVLVPYEILLVSGRTLLGQKIRVTYGKKGKVEDIELNGNSLFVPFYLRKGTQPENSETEVVGKPP